jgi:hypothetical protein
LHVVGCVGVPDHPGVALVAVVMGSLGYARAKVSPFRFAAVEK